MRINHPKHGDRRTRTFFAWYPVHCANANQTRWWETVTVEEFYTDTYDEWTVNAFIDAKEKKSYKAFKQSNQVLNEIIEKVQNP